MSGDIPRAESPFVAPFVAAFMDCRMGNQSLPFRWRIRSIDYPWQSWNYSEDGFGDLGFASRRDCERAIQSLSEAGIVDDGGMERLSDEQLAAIALGDLAW